MIRVRTRDLTLVCEFNFSGLPFHLFFGGVWNLNLTPRIYYAL